MSTVGGGISFSWKAWVPTTCPPSFLFVMYCHHLMKGLILNWVCDVLLSFSGTRGYISFFSLFPTIRRILIPLFLVKSEAGSTWASSDSLWITAPELENCLINHDVIPSKAVRARAPGAAHCQQLHRVLRCGEAQVGLCSDFKVLPSAVSLFSTELPALSRMQCRALHTRLWLEIT